MKGIYSFLAALLALAVLLTLGSWAAETVPVDTAGLVRFASDQGVAARRGNAEAGVLVAVAGQDSGSNAVAHLYIGDPDGRYLPVRDRHALRRVPFFDMDYPDFYIEPGTNTALVGDHTVRMFDGDYIPSHSQIDPNVPTYTRTFRVVPINGKVIEQARAKCTHFEAVGWSGLAPETVLLDLSCDVTAAGEVVVQATVKARDVAVTYTVDVEIRDVLGRDGHASDPVDDLTRGDYKFIDKYGKTSLGNLRSWVRDVYDRQRAQHWADYPASNTVDFANHVVKFNRDSFFRPSTIEAVNDGLELWRNGQLVFRSVTSVSSTNGTFRIVGIDFGSSDEYNFVYTDTSAPTAPWVTVCDAIEDAAWVRPVDQYTAMGTWKGEAAWCIAVSKTEDPKKFYRANFEDGGSTGPYLYTEATVYAHGSVAIPDSNGVYWKLKVSTTGELTTEKVTNKPAGVDR